MTSPTPLPFDKAGIASSLIAFIGNFCCVCMASSYPRSQGEQVTLVGDQYQVTPPPAPPPVSEETALMVALTITATFGLAAVVLGGIAVKRGRAKQTRGMPFAIIGILLGALALSQPCVAGGLFACLDNMPNIRF